MKKINLCAFLRKEAFFRLPERGFSGYTLAEIIVVILIIAVIVAVTIGITKAKLDNIVSYTYYNAYSTLRSISTEMLADWDPQDPEYKQALNKENHFNFQLKLANIKNNILGGYRDLWSQPVFARCASWGVPIGGSCPRGKLCNSAEHFEGDGCFACCTPKSTGGGSLNPPYDPKPPNDWQEPAYCFCNSLGNCPPSQGYDCTAFGGSAHSCTPCSCKVKNCSVGYKFNSKTCECEPICGGKTCPSGQLLNQSTCTCRCAIIACNPGYKLNSNTCQCEPSYKCWDGSYATSEANCPSSVTCWDGNKKHDWSECPPCTNKPDPLPCGQGWDEHTCQLTGTAKTCPSGQHLNSGCNCVNDCPSNLTACQKCDNESGVISQNPDVNRSCSEETYEWSEEQCKCIPSPRTLPRKGMNFCKLFERHANIMSGSDVCSGSVITTGTTDFSTKSPDITLRNGLRVYNMHSDASSISQLANNIQGGVYDGVPNTNEWGYTVYVDIDGAKGDSQLWSDVYPFYITLSGKIIPAYDHNANPDGAGGDSIRHLQVSVEKENYTNGKRSIKWLAKSVPFKEGACIAGYVGDATPYCKNGTSITKSSECTETYNSMCRVKQIKPVKFFF